MLHAIQGPPNVTGPNELQQKQNPKKTSGRHGGPLVKTKQNKTTNKQSKEV